MSKVEERLDALRNDERAERIRTYWQAGVSNQDKIYLAKIDGEIAGLQLALHEQEQERQHQAKHRREV